MNANTQVAMVTASLSPLAGGMFYSARIPANLMAERGRSPWVLGLHDEQYDANRKQWQVDSITVLPRSGPAGFLSARPMQKVLERSAPELVHLRGLWGPDSLAVYRWQKATGKPFLISPHGMLDPYALGYSAVKKQVARKLFIDALVSSAGAIHALNASEAQSIRAFGATNPIAIIPNGVSAAEPIGRIAKPAGPFRMSFLARLHPKKNVDGLLRGWRQALDQGEGVLANWQLVIAGWDDGGHLPQFQKLAQDLGLQDHVVFTGPKFDAEKTAFLNEADAFILPSHSEGLPVSVMEAWERSLPVLMTDACNLPEGFARGAAMQLGTDPSDIAAKLLEFFGLPEASRLAMGQKGRDMVVESYSWDHITTKYCQLYDWLSGRDKNVPDFIELP